MSERQDQAGADKNEQYAACENGFFPREDGFLHGILLFRVPVFSGHRLEQTLIKWAFPACLMLALTG